MTDDVKAAIRSWWAEHPMTYGLDHGEAKYLDADGTEVRVALGSKNFFERADEKLLSWNEPLHDEKGPFSRLFDYERFKGRPVLEVGCGMGCMAMNWARRGARLTAVDLNPVAVEQTRRRFEVFGLEGDVRAADAENLPFADESFDYAYSWGVLHHTPGTRTALREMWRILRPGGGLGIMLYNRNSLFYRSQIAFQEGFVNMENLFLDPVRLASRYGDAGRQDGNPHTWPVTAREARRSFFPPEARVRIRVLGTDVPETLNTWFPSLGRLMPRSWLRAVERRWGWSLWIEVEKPA